MVSIFNFVENAVAANTANRECLATINSGLQIPTKPTNCSERYPEKIPGTHYVQIGKLTVPINDGRIQTTLWESYDHNCDGVLSNHEAKKYYSDNAIATILVEQLRNNSLDFTTTQLDLLLLESAIVAVDKAYKTVEWLKAIPSLGTNCDWISCCREYSANSWKTIEENLGTGAEKYPKRTNEAIINFFNFAFYSSSVVYSYYYHRQCFDDNSCLITAVDHWIDISETLPSLKPIIKALAYRTGEIAEFTKYSEIECSGRQCPETDESEHPLPSILTDSVGIVDGEQVSQNRIGLYLTESYVNADFMVKLVEDDEDETVEKSETKNREPLLLYLMNNRGEPEIL